MASYGGYNPPNSYGYQPYAPQHYMPQSYNQPYPSPTASRLAQYENTQYNQNQTMSPNPQMNQSMNPSELLIAVSTLDEARNHLPDMNGAKQIFSIQNAPEYLGAKQLDYTTGRADFVLFKQVMPEEQITGSVQINEDAPESSTEGPKHEDVMQEVECRISAVQGEMRDYMDDMMKKWEEKIDAKLSSLSANVGAAKPADGADVPKHAGDDADGGVASSDDKQPVAAEPRKSGTATAKREKPAGN